jgi:2-polyprenyl-6-methoxyphenol hydroxylase-like FAD-dependent oxidoreductase
MNDLPERADVDVLIAGGGVAGAAVAAALAQLGLTIQIIEPGPSHGRRLAGELIHPPGVDGLRALGLLDELGDTAARVDGFAIFRDSHDGATTAEILPYDDREGSSVSGLVIEHRRLKESLLAKVGSFAGVTVRMNARVTAMHANSDNSYRATVCDEHGETAVRAKLVVAADGPLSQVRKLIGITHATQRYSAMMGIEVDEARLPHKGYGNIFLSPAGVSYAYAIGGGRARVMFEVLRDADPKDSIRTQLANFPVDFRRDIETELAGNKPLAAPNFCIIPKTSIKGNVALIGDARGCCHPLTASGITAAVTDALILRDALRDTGMNIPAALRRYARIGNRLQLTRRTLAEELREAFLAQTPEAQLLSECIFSYWRSSPAGRRRSMALLSTVDSSILSLATQYLTVVMHAIGLIPQWGRERTLADWAWGVARLLRKSLGFQRSVIGQWFSERYPVAE